MLGAIIGGVASIGGALLGKSSADKASARASESEAKMLAFEQQKYDDWQSVFGPIQQNLSKYYQSITPEQYEATGLEAVESEYTTMSKRLQETLAQRGIQDSGISLALSKDLGVQKAEAKAEVRRAAPAAAAAEQAGFLQIGMGSNPSMSMSNTLQNLATNAANRADVAARGEAAAWQSAIKTVGTGLSDYFGDKEDE